MVTKATSNIINNIKVFVRDINIRHQRWPKKERRSEWKERKKQSRNSPSKKQEQFIDQMRLFFINGEEIYCLSIVHGFSKSSAVFVFNFSNRRENIRLDVSHGYHENSFKTHRSVSYIFQRRLVVLFFLVNYIFKIKYCER